MVGAIGSTEDVGYLVCVHIKARQCNNNNNRQKCPHRPCQLNENLYVALIKNPCYQQFANGEFKENESKQKKTYLLLLVDPSLWLLPSLSVFVTIHID